MLNAPAQIAKLTAYRQRLLAHLHSECVDVFMTLERKQSIQLQLTDTFFQFPRMSLELLEETYNDPLGDLPAGAPISDVAKCNAIDDVLNTLLRVPASRRDIRFQLFNCVNSPLQNLPRRDDGSFRGDFHAIFQDLEPKLQRLAVVQCLIYLLENFPLMQRDSQVYQMRSENWLEDCINDTCREDLTSRWTEIKLAILDKVRDVLRPVSHGWQNYRWNLHVWMQHFQFAQQRPLKQLLPNHFRLIRSLLFLLLSPILTTLYVIYLPANLLGILLSRTVRSIPLLMTSLGLLFALPKLGILAMASPLLAGLSFAQVVSTSALILTLVSVMTGAVALTTAIGINLLATLNRWLFSRPVPARQPDIESPAVAPAINERPGQRPSPQAIVHQFLQAIAVQQSPANATPDLSPQAAQDLASMASRRAPV